MKEVYISESVTSIVNAKKIIDSISVINNKIEESKKTAENLIENINQSSNLLQKAKNDNSITRKVFKWSTETLFSFIIESNNATHSSVSSISKLIQNNNDNSKLLAEMIGKLAMLSGLSFEKNSETTAQLEEMAKNFEQNSSGNTEQARQIKRVILAHINKIKEEKNKADRIEFNFGIINDNLKELNKNLNAINIENDKKIALIQESLNAKLNVNNIENNKEIVLIPELLNSKSEEHFVKIQNKQRKLINYLGAFSLVTFLILISFISYYFNVNS
ncbi:hypothetical protein E0I26_08475 [Flavobacterium rhamnosiphilum]|uniref:Uncharacterized protein n=1 Tax=Flavobacterium rhamnosiphilum TaxID=2541724 RepID=A0A4R5F811_9FLAO|nr:hypothetical protein [Flavobacterium rhamnosiphilum]TDE44396.1 hypothetical protein E0I26_08475 [Flavobacterium rhamnosiphilum]